MVLLLVIAGAGGAASEEQATPVQPPAKASRVVVLTGDGLTVAEIVDIADGRAAIAVSAEGMERIRSARAVVDHYIQQGLPACGITTMYGADFETTLPPA